MFHILCFLLLMVPVAVAAEPVEGMAAEEKTDSVVMPTTVAEWTQRLTTFGKNIPQEKVYVHMDNSCYFLGDTIWFKAYLHRTDKDIPSALSRVLYAELYNQDGFLVQRKLIKMTNGEGCGNFALLDTLYGGYYELRAYTRWQLNWGMTQHPHSTYAEEWFYNKAMAREYYRDYDKLYSRVFPVYDKPKQAGEFYHDMTVRPLRRIYASPDDTAKVVLSVYPEGGFLVAGAPCRLACEAVTTKGEWLTGTFQLVEGQETNILEAQTQNRGRALLSFTPQEGKKYKVTFTPSSQFSVLSSQSQTLKKILKDGVAVQVNQSDTMLVISLSPRGTAATQPIGMTIMREGVVVESRTIENVSQPTITIPLPLKRGEEDSFKPGVHQLTVFDATGRVYADRLFFVQRKDFSYELRIQEYEGLQPSYKPYAPISFTIKAPEEAANTHLSVAVRDAANADFTYDDGNILTEMLLASEIKGFVPQPGWFFEKDDAEHREALDLLMLTQGWRRFNWKEMATPKAFALLHPYEYTQVLNGVVHKYSATLKEDPIFEADRAFHEEKIHQPTDGESLKDPWADEEEEPDDLSAGEDAYKELRESLSKPTLRETTYRADGVLASSKFHEDEGSLKREVRVHAEFVQPGSNSVLGDVDTQRGKFRMQIPSFSENCVLFLGASDTVTWKHDQPHQWVQMDEEEYPEFYVRLSFPYPRFVKPYTFYQTRLAQTPEDFHALQNPEFDSEKVKMMKTVTVRAQHGGLRAFDASKPAFVIDAYEAFNAVADAGLSAGWYIGSSCFFCEIARNYIGDMGMSLPYNVEPRYNTHNKSYYMSDADRHKYDYLYNLDKVYVYTDYSPRQEGDKRFDKDQPEISVDLRRYEDESRRVTYRDRRYILPGFAVPDDFYSPDYSGWKLDSENAPKDYRRTLYWNPDVVLDEAGTAQIKLYNNAKETIVDISAAGQTKKGKFLISK